MLELNPLDLEAEKDYMIYLDVILQDEFFKKEEIKKFKEKKAEYNSDKINFFWIFLTKKKVLFYYVMDIPLTEKYFILVRISLPYSDSLEKKYQILPLMI